MATIVPLHPLVGAEVKDLDMSKPFEDETVKTLKDAFAKHFVLVLRGQHDLRAEDQQRFAQLFGEVTYRGTYRDTPMTEMYVSNTRKDGILPDGELAFHNDQLHFDVPTSACTLYAMEVPKEGGDTLFSATMSVYEDLPKETQEKLDGLRAEQVFDGRAKEYNVRMTEANTTSNAKKSTQRVVWRNPETGRKSIWVSKITTVKIEGLPQEEGDALIADLVTRIEDPAKVYHHTWQVGDLVVWDNWSVQHMRTDFDRNERRNMRRMPIMATDRRFN